MKCPHCAHTDTRVINSRSTNGGESIRRRRSCPSCGGRFTTFEVVEKAEQTVVKRNGARVPYSADRLKNGIMKACRKRPVTEAQIENIVRYVEKEAFRSPNQEVHTEKLGSLVLKRLKDVDKVAYIRFASVYRDFSSLQDFKAEIAALLKS